MIAVSAKSDGTRRSLFRIAGHIAPKSAQLLIILSARDPMTVFRAIFVVFELTGKAGNVTGNHSITLTTHARMASTTRNVVKLIIGKFT
jgi:hypothetical protein